jgi:hypothetical protein
MGRKWQTQSTFVVKFVRHFSTPTIWRIEASTATAEPSPTPTHIRLNILLIMRGLLCCFETAVASVKIQGSGMLSRWRKRSKGLILFEFCMLTSHRSKPCALTTLVVCLR